MIKKGDLVSLRYRILKDSRAAHGGLRTFLRQATIRAARREGAGTARRGAGKARLRGRPARGDADLRLPRPIRYAQFVETQRGRFIRGEEAHVGRVVKQQC